MELRHSFCSVIPPENTSHFKINEGVVVKDNKPMYNVIIISKVIYNDMYKRYAELYVTVDAKRAPKSGFAHF